MFFPSLYYICMEKVCGYKANDGNIYSTPEEVSVVEYKGKLHDGLKHVLRFIVGNQSARFMDSRGYDSKDYYAKERIWETLEHRFSKEFEIRALKVAIDEYLKVLDNQPKLPVGIDKPKKLGFFKSLFN